LYRDAGWLGTLPLGSAPGRKSPPPGGFTGHGAPYPDGGDIGMWLSGPEAERNIGLRMPAGVIGLDIDAAYTKIENGKAVEKRGQDTLAELEAQYGPLPPTWVSSARPAPSGIRFYRVPESLDGRPINWPGEAGKFIEIIQPGHRYAVAWPSTNPDADGAVYEWRHELYDFVVPPSPGDLTPLPDAWLRGLALPYDRTDKADLADAALAGWWTQLRPGDPCPVIHSVWTRAANSLRTDAGSRHETARDALRALLGAGGSGHRGAARAAEQLAEVFGAAVGPDRMASGEWQRLISGAVKLAATDNPVPRQHCEHDAATPIEAPPGFMPHAPPAPGPAQAAPQLPDDESREAVDALIAEVAALPSGDEQDAAVRRIAASLPASGVAETEIQRARAALTTREGGSRVSLGDWNAIVRDARTSAKEAAKEAAAAQRRYVAAAELAEAKERGALLPPPHAPIDVARHLAEKLPAAARWWRGDYYLWDGTRYAPWAPEAVDNWIYRETEHAKFDGGKDDDGPVPWRPDETKVTKVSHALSRGVLYRASTLDPDDQPAQVACRNGVFDVASGELLAHTPDRFNLQSVPFDYEPTATAPLWEWFLSDVLPPDAQVLLQEWFGYIISGRTDLEKILHMQGLPRSGKGTVANMLEALIGSESVASPSMPGLVGTFGEQPLIGKSLAVLSDINWQFRDIAEAVEIVKKISGRDTRDVNRKNRDVWHGRLDVRFMIMGNDLPKFTDASGALSHRMVHVRFPGTVMGRENPSLKDGLLKELPGVLNWALAGLARLMANGRFTEAASAAELAAEVRRQQSPIQGFLDDCCTINPAANPAPLDELFPVYRSWAKRADVDHPMDRERFSRGLASAGLKVERKMINGVRARRVHGIAPAGVSTWAALLNPELQPATEVSWPPSTPE
jgi:putative DNA primase/helicase